MVQSNLLEGCKKIERVIRPFKEWESQIKVNPTTTYICNIMKNTNKPINLMITGMVLPTCKNVVHIIFFKGKRCEVWLDLWRKIYQHLEYQINTISFIMMYIFIRYTFGIVDIDSCLNILGKIEIVWLFKILIRTMFWNEECIVLNCDVNTHM
jgi:hypothetical protein